MNSKICSKCKQTLDINEFHLKGKDKMGNPRRISACISCSKFTRLAKCKKDKKNADYISMYDVEIIYTEALTQKKMSKIEYDFIGAIY